MSEMIVGDVLKLAHLYRVAGLSIIPIRTGQKRPATKWKEFQSEIPSKSNIEEWFTSNYSSMALICGIVSGNVELLDIDNHFKDAPKIFAELKELVANQYPELWSKFVVQQTQSGGYHLIYKCSQIEGNLKLANRINTQGNPDVVLETRGEGGYALISPSPGYSVIQGSLENIQEISVQEREFLFQSCKSFNQLKSEVVNPTPQIATPQKSTTVETIETGNYPPGEDFNNRGDIKHTLQSHGWTLHSIYAGKEEWIRPGKPHNGDISATFNAPKSPNLFYVFSTSTVFEARKGYSKFAVEAILNYNGDFSACAKALSERGYGSKPKTYSLNGYDFGNFNGDIVPHTNGNGKSHQNYGIDTPDLLELKYTDMGNAIRFKVMFQNKVKYNYTVGCWYIYDGKRWKIDESRYIVELAKQTILKIHADAIKVKNEEVQKAMVKWALTSQNVGKIEAMLKLAQSMKEFAVAATDFDSNPYHFNLANGVYDLETNQLLPHNPEFMISKLSDIEYDPNAKCDYWLDSLDFYFNYNSDFITYINKCLAITMCGAHLEELIFFLYGLGKNGKSIFIKVLEMLFGEYASKALIDMLLLTKSDQGIPNDVARLKGSRFVVTSELPAGKRLNESRVKDLTGGDMITARFLHKEFFEFKPSHTLWIFGNHKPSITGGDEGIWRRMVLIPFENPVPDDMKRSPQELINIFKSELPGILAWIIEGWKLYQSEGMVVPDTILRATRAYREEQDILADFIHDCCDTTSTINRVKTKDLHRHYQKWCEENKETTVLKSKSFNSAIEERGFKKRDSGSGREKEFVGISIKSGMF